ncbi:MAG TPA: LysE family transporter [Thermomicrobiales bacterium]|jgi:chemosensory pili system protein ChpE
METLFVAAFGLGLTFCAPPGVITAEALRRGIARGFRPAFLIEIGSLVGDAAWAILALAGAALLVQNRPMQLVLGGVGIFFLLRLAWGALEAAWRGDAPESRSGLPGGDFAAGATLSLANPLAIGFWLGMGGVLTGLGIADPRPEHYLVFFGGFMLACLVWCVLIAALIAWGRRFVTPGFFRVINFACGVALGCFALRLGLALIALATA